MHRVNDKEFCRIKVWKPIYLWPMNKGIRDMIFSCIFGITFLPYICIISYFISISLYKPLTYSIKSTKICLISVIKVCYLFTSMTSGTSRYEPQSFLTAGMSHAQHIIAARIYLLEVLFVNMSIPSHNSINWSIIGAK